MNLSAKARSLAGYLSKIEERLLSLNPSEIEKRYQLFSIVIDKCTRFESKLGTTGVSLLKIIRQSPIRPGNVNRAPRQQLKIEIDRLIRACYLAAAKASIR